MYNDIAWSWTAESDVPNFPLFYHFVLLKGQCPILRQMTVTRPHKKEEAISSCVELN